MTLNYLRLADPTAYAHEFDALWTHPNLRRHVKHLLVDFLAQVEQPAPADWEQARLVGALRDPSWRVKVLSAITGRAAWFRLFAGSVLPAEMRRPYDEAWAVVWVLVSALGSDRDRCLGLMRENWFPDGAKLPRVWQTLTYLAEWDEPAADLAVAVVRGSLVAQGGMWHLAQAIAKGAPLLAVRLVAAWLDAARHRATGAEASAELRKLLDSHNTWHDVEELANQVPVEFARALWPAVCDIITRQEGYASTVVVRYADDMMAFARLDRREYVRLDSPDHFYLAFDSALRAFARTRPAEFLTTVGSGLGSDSRLLQRLVCRGVRELAPDPPPPAPAEEPAVAHLVGLLIFAALAAASWGVAVAVYRSTAGGPDRAAAPHDRLVRAIAVGAVADTSFMPFDLGYGFGVLAWFSAVYGWLGLPAARAALLVLYLAAASLVARLAVGGITVAFFP